MRSTIAQRSSRSVFCERSTLPFRCGEAGLFGLNLMPYPNQSLMEIVCEELPHLTIFVSASRFRQNSEEIYSTAASWRLHFPTSYTLALVASARDLLERIYKAGFIYHKAGVFLTDIVADTERQQSLLHRIDDERRLRLMDAVDRINRRHGRHTLRPLAMGNDRRWVMRRGCLSGRYTTHLDEVLRVKAD